jgi:signal peptidase II|tara:strand:- start:7654 stop:8160 length:507 start_codon:yes stop_codon:yes gene_type:complete
MNFLINLKEIKSYFLKKENIYFSAIIIIIFSFDRISKLEIINKFNQSSYYVNDFINLDLIWNTGIGFGIFSTDSNLLYNLISFTIGSVIIILMYALIVSKKIDKLIYSIIIGGALGNFYDRILYKAVPDFIDLHYGNFHWFTFNLADIFITMGILIFITRSFFVDNEK